MSSSLPLAARSCHRSLLLLAVAAAALLCASPSLLVLAQEEPSSTSEFEFDGTNYYYTLFTNNMASASFADGTTAVGRYGAPGFGAAFDATGVVFSDMTRGSRIRKITNAGELVTLAGSSTKRGCTAGSPTEARFSSNLNSGFGNAMVAVTGGLYFADTLCSTLRFLNSTTYVTTNIRTFAAVSSASQPVALAKTPYAGTNASVIYVTDTANNNIRILNSDTPSSVLDGEVQSSDGVFAPIGIAIFPSIQRVVVTNRGTNFIYLDYASSSSAPTTATWRTLSTVTTTSPLVASFDDLNVEFISGNTILSMPVNTAEANAGTATATTVFTFTPLSTEITGVTDPETMLLFAPRTADSYYILTTHRYLIVSATQIGGSSSSSSSSGGRSSSSSSSSGSETTTTPTPTPTPTPTTAPPTSPPEPREDACDDVCKGAIASSVVMACAGAVLIVLMIIAPANIFTAVVMVPII